MRYNPSLGVYPIEAHKGADVASAATLQVGTRGSFFKVTGTTGITAISARPKGRVITLHFASSLLITHNATSLILRDGISLRTHTNTILTLISEGSGNWREIGRSASRLDEELHRLLVLGPQVNFGMSDWTTAVTGSGSVSQDPRRRLLGTGTTASSSALARSNPFELSRGDVTINYARRVLFAFGIRRANSDAEAVSYVQIKIASTHGDLAAVGMGIKVTNYTAVGESYGTARGVTSTLSTITDQAITFFVLDFDPGRGVIDFYVNGVLQQTQSTAANLPSGSQNSSQVVSSVANGATGGVNVQVVVGSMELIQE